MGRKGYSPEEITANPREIEVRLSQSETITQAVWVIGVTEQTYYRWRKEYARPASRPGQADEGDREGERPAAARRL